MRCGQEFGATVHPTVDARFWPGVGARLGDESGEVVAEAAEARLSGISAEVGACRLGPCCGKHRVVLRGATVTGVAGAAGKNRHLQRGEPDEQHQPVGALQPAKVEVVQGAHKEDERDAAGGQAFALVRARRPQMP